MTRHEPSDHDFQDHESPDRASFDAVHPDHGSVGRAFAVLLLSLALICGAVAAGAIWNAGVRADRDLALHRHQVTATTTEPARDRPGAVRYGGAAPPALAHAVWSYPKDVARSGTISVPPKTPKGHELPLWVDDTGTPARPPGGTAERALTSLSGGTVAAGAVAASGAGALLLVRRRARNRRYAAWEREWEQVEPVWSGRLPRGGGPGPG
ncbi:hypothetical protein [Streptomyces sp. NPDC048623]|uniref:Rv1733c family protein n=1 Tax=Streptomyces sp. NPDC048623 TaxID=3155761 RepID=UPI0034218703